MELLQGRDLFDILVKERRLSEQRAAKILMEVCDVLTVAHEQGIVHRDLKPENIMILTKRDPQGRERIKVLDFGIAKVLDKEPKEPEPTVDGAPPPESGVVSSALTTVGVIVGTPEYMSPEQCRGESVDTRSDIYACGILLYQLITGQIPFTGDSIIDIALKHIRQPPPKPSNYLPFMHAGLEAIIMTALEKWPAQRQQTAGELKASLQKILPELRTTPFRLGGTSKDDAPPPPSRRNMAEVPVDSVRFANDTIPNGEPPQMFGGTMRSEDLDKKRAAIGQATPGSADAEHDTDPSDLGTGEGIVIRVRNRLSDPVLSGSPTIPAAPGLSTDTLASGPRGARGSDPGSKLPATPRVTPAETADKPILIVAKPLAAHPAFVPPKAPIQSNETKPAPAQAMRWTGSKKKGGGASFWLLVPVAILVGITVGAIVFFLTQ